MGKWLFGIGVAALIEAASLYWYPVESRAVMRAVYVRGWQGANWLTGNDFRPPDRFK